MIEEENTSNDNKLVKVLLIIFVLFLVMYISKETGIYEYKTYNKTKITKENIEQFEKDLSEGKNVTLNDYIVNDYKDYSNIVSRCGSSLSKLVEKLLNSGIKKTLKIISALFYE